VSLFDSQIHSVSLYFENNSQATFAGLTKIFSDAYVPAASCDEVRSRGITIDCDALTKNGAMNKGFKAPDLFGEGSSIVGVYQSWEAYWWDGDVHLHMRLVEMSGFGNTLDVKYSSIAIDSKAEEYWKKWQEDAATRKAAAIKKAADSL
jgi:hypothetical protein